MGFLNKILKRKVTCMNCKNEYFIKDFSLDVNKKKCNYCIKKEQDKKKQEQKKQRQETMEYSSKYIKELFIRDMEPYVSDNKVCMDIHKEQPCIEHFRDCGHGGLGYGGIGDISITYISFEEVKDFAKNISEELYEKYKNINETNWKEYI